MNRIFNFLFDIFYISLTEIYHISIMNISLRKYQITALVINKESKFWTIWSNTAELLTKIPSRAAHAIPSSFCCSFTVSSCVRSTAFSFLVETFFFNFFFNLNRNIIDFWQPKSIKMTKMLPCLNWSILFIF